MHQLKIKLSGRKARSNCNAIRLTSYATHFFIPDLRAIINHSMSKTLPFQFVEATFVALNMVKKITHVLNNEYKFIVTGSLWIECEGERFLGKGRVELLELIAETGSINKAATKMGMSYKKAWQMIKMLNANTSNPVVITQAGGEKRRRIGIDRRSSSIDKILPSFAGAICYVFKM